MKVLDKIRESRGTVRAAVYARFSSDNQRDESIDAQLRAIKLADYIFDEMLIPKICEAYGAYQLSKNVGHIKTKANYEKKIKGVTKSIDNIVEMIMTSPSPALAKKLSELEQEKEQLNESYQKVCKNTNIKQLNEEEITKMFRLARNQLEVGTLKNDEGIG